MAFLGRLLGLLLSSSTVRLHNSGVPKFGHISELMRDTLHRLPVRQRIHYRFSTIVWRCVLGIAPTYLLEPFTLTSACTGPHSLRSASRGVLWCLVVAQPLSKIAPSRL